MSQLSFWDEPGCSTSPAHAKSDVGGYPSAVPARENKSALRCGAAAEAMQKHIDAKHQSANHMLTKPPTRKRLSDADGLRNQAIRLERIQAILRKLADMHINGTITPELAGFTTRSSIESALFTSAGDSAIRLLYNSSTAVEGKKERVLRLINEAAMMDIPGYFPTPRPLAERLVAMARIESGNTVLEPSAGTGNLIDAILKSHNDVRVSYCEMNCFLLDILRAKYEGVKEVRFLGRDYFEIDTIHGGNRFDRIIMNPPFERGQDAEHVLRAWYSLLAPKGILTAIVSGGVLSRTDKSTKSFREFLRNKRADVHDVPAGSFKSSGTEVNSKIVQVQAVG